MARSLRDIIPLDESRLSRIVQTLDAGKPVGTISPEKSKMVGKQKAQAHKALQADLERERKKGMISWTGPHAGRYKYDAEAEPSKEGSYVVKPGNHPKAQENIHRILRSLAKKYGQESFLKVKKRGEKATGALYFPQSKKVEPMGQVHYNEPLDTGSGDTKLKGSGSFTVRKG